jgi:hypothetical protein
MAAMRVPKTVAICIDGGLMVIDPRKDTIDVVALESAGREEAVAFEEVGQCIDCLHSQSDGKELRISRVKVGDLKQKRTTTLPPTGEAASDLLTDTRGGGTRGSYTNTSAPLVYSRPHTSKPCSSRREDALWKLPRTHSRCAGL